MAGATPLAEALESLTKAVDAAEAAVADVEASRAAAAAGLRESDAADAELTELKREHANLRTVADDVTRRLDSAIDQVEAILSGKP